MKLNMLLTALLITGFSACKPEDPKPDDKKEEKVSLSMMFNPTFNGQPLSWTNTYITGPGDTVVFDKVKFLLSGFTLEKQNGELIVLKDQYAYLSLKEGRKGVMLSDVPKGDYKSIRFQVGIDSAVNHADPSKWPFDHPLNPSLTDMHWGWSGGYIFNIIEGNFKKNGQDAGFTFHIATMKYARTHSFIYDYKLDKNGEFNFDVRMEKYFDNALEFSLKLDGAFSHSGNDDEVMDLFIQNTNGVLDLKSFN